MSESARAIAQRIHRRFRVLPGAEHIATETAIAGLVLWLRRTQPRRILEVGAGIGTLTATVLEVLDALPEIDGRSLVTVEDHPFCRHALAENLGGGLASATLVEDVASLPSDAGFDFMIVDGGRTDDPSLFARLNVGATVFIEGDRLPQVAVLEGILGGRHTWARADVRTLRRRTLEEGRKVYDGGYRIYRLAPTSAERLWLAVIDLRTKLVYRLRSLARRFVT